MHQALLCLLLVAACGQPPVPRANESAYPIVGGATAPDTLVPAAGALVLDVPGNYRVFCSGTLVGTALVLTAAHCFDSLSPATTPLGFFAGLSIQPTDFNPPLAPVASIHLAPGYAGGTPPGWIDDYNDIALVTLTASPAVKPALLVQPDNLSRLVKTGAGVMLLGFGQTVAGAKTSTGVKTYGVSTLGQVGTHEFHVVGSGAPQKCHGDSGGPSLGDLDSGTGHDFRLIGVTSRADVDCSLGSLETRVDAHLSWIHSVGGASIPCGSGLNPACVDPPQCSVTAANCPTGHDCIPLVKGADEGECVLAPPPKKQLGEPCLLGSECEGGWCAYLAGQRFCTELCDDQNPCAQGLVCTQAENQAKMACVPQALVPVEEGGGCAVTPAPLTSSSIWPWVAFLLLVSRRRTDR